MPQLYPLSFRPVLKQYTWGGRNLERLGRRLPPGAVAESWEISAHPSGPTPVRSGPLAGLSLIEVQRRLGAALVGRRNAEAVERGRFPLLIKLLDAHRWLSVQVHPDDRYARALHAEPGKTEMWVVLHAEPGAELIYGFRRRFERDEVERAIAEGRLETLLRRVRASTGDVFFVPPGTVHALGPGLLLAEIQQASDLTFRLYDWDRDEAERQLHLAEGLAVARLEPGRAAPLEPRRLEGRAVPGEEIGRCRHFATERLYAPRGAAFEGECHGETFEIWGALEGRLTLRCSGADPAELSAVDWLLLPAELGRFVLEARERSVLLRVRVPAG